MLDWAHATALKAAARGHGEDSPAMRALVECGLAAHDPATAGYSVTPAGEAALRAGTPSRVQRIALRVGAVAVVVYAVATIADWLT